MTDMLNVVITGYDTSTNEIMYQTAYGEERTLDGSMRMKGTGWPQPGENWVLKKIGTLWVPYMQLGTPTIPTITGSTDGVSDVVKQLISILTQSGMAIDATIGTPAVVPVEVQIGDGVDPSDPDADADGYDADHDVDIDLEPIPIDDDGPIPTDDDFGSGVNQSSGSQITLPVAKPPTTISGNTWVPLYVTTYNTLKDVGPQGAYADLLRMTTQTAADVIMLQEAHNNNRDAGFQTLGNRGWSRFRPKVGAFSDENTIIWKTARFGAAKASGCIYLGRHTAASSPMPPRYLNWVLLHDSKTGRDMYFMDTHLDPHLESGGKPRTEASVAVRIALAKNMIKTIKTKMGQFGAIAPVFTAGDWNIDWVGDNRQRTKDFPVAQFAQAKTIANWGAATKTRIGTSGNRYIDQIYLTRGADWQIQVAQNFVLTGYRSDHRAAMVKYLVRSK